MTPRTPEAQQTTTIVSQREELWQGPLPHPATLEQFRQVVPDAPERIIRQWEEEAAHRRAYEKTALDGALRRDERGQWFAVAFAMGALLVTGIALHYGQPWVAAILGTGTIGSVVGAFLYQRKNAK